jgi:hypothetical protein
LKTTYSSVLCLGNNKIQNSSLDEAPAAEDDISLPGNILEGHGNTELSGEKSYIRG